jgi:hypothetical protein
MKITFTLICFLALRYSFCQTTTLQKLWVGDADNYMLVDKDIVRFEYRLNYQGKIRTIQAAYQYKIIADTFRIIQPDSFNSSDHDYLIKAQTEDQITLVPVKKYAATNYMSFPVREIYTFQNRNNIYTDSILFEKIVFSSTTCYGNCPEMAFTIDSNRQMKFEGKQNAIKQGLYNAVLSPQLYEELLNILAVSDLDKITDLNQFNIDAATYTLEVYYNGKIKSFKSFCFSYVAYDLFYYLIALPKKVEFVGPKSADN